MKKTNFFKYLKVQVSLYFLFASLLLIVLLGSVLYYSVSNIMLENELKATTNSVEKSGKYIEVYVDKIKSFAEILSKDTDVKNFMITKDTESRKKTLELISNILSTDEFLVSVIMVSKDGEIISNEKELDMMTSDDMMNQEWYVNAVHNESMPILTSIRQQEFSMDKKQWVISVSQEITDDKGDNLGVLLIDIKYLVIEDYLKDLNLGKSGYSFILNEKYKVVYHPDTSYFEDLNKINSLKGISEMHTGYDEKMRMLTHHYNIQNTNWILTGISSLDDLKMIQRQIMETLIFVGIILFIITIGSGIFIAGKITNPIKDLEEAMKNIDEGLNTVEINEKGCYEAVSLAHHFNTMTEKIKVLMENISKNEKYLRTYEINALYSQINPHFLYNTLDTIVWMAEFNESEKVILVAKSLAKFFRISLSKGDEMISLKDEIEHVNQYLFIQKQRYGEKLTYEFIVDPKIEGMKIPKIILQPLVENAIYHGIREADIIGKILIEAYVNKDEVNLIITDNGVGFKITESNKSELKLGGIGIDNVNKRIKLYFGDTYGITIDSKVGEGTRVLIRLPYYNI